MLTRKLESTEEDAVFDSSGHALGKAAQRGGVVSWFSLFPPAHGTAADFGRLAMERPTGPGCIGDLTTTTSGNAVTFSTAPRHRSLPHEPTWITAVIPDASGLRGVPHILRKTNCPPVLGDIRLRARAWSRSPSVTGPSATHARRATRTRSLVTGHELASGPHTIRRLASSEGGRIMTTSDDSSPNQAVLFVGATFAFALPQILFRDAPPWVTVVALLIGAALFAGCVLELRKSFRRKQKR